MTHQKSFTLGKILMHTMHQCATQEKTKTLSCMYYQQKRGWLRKFKGKHEGNG